MAREADNRHHSRHYYDMSRPHELNGSATPIRPGLQDPGGNDDQNRL